MKWTPVSPRVQRGSLGALSDLEIAVEQNEGRTSPPQHLAAGTRTPWPGHCHQWVCGTHSCPAPHQPPASQAASRLRRAPHYF